MDTPKKYKYKDKHKYKYKYKYKERCFDIFIIYSPAMSQLLVMTIAKGDTPKIDKDDDKYKDNDKNKGSDKCLSFGGKRLNFWWYFLNFPR